MSKVKICGIYREEDMKAINETIPDYIGFILNFPKSHRNISYDQACLLRNKLIHNIQVVGVFVNAEIECIQTFVQHGIIDIIQLHGDEDDSYIESLRNQIPNVEIWKAYQIKKKEDIEQARSSIADRIVLDNGYGTGQCFDWSLVTNLTKPVILAGGLNPENIVEAIQTIHPYAIDISSGVETNKQKDPNKIHAAVLAARSIQN